MGSRQGSAAPSVRLLFITTVAHTIARFLLPYAAHFRGLGWQVDAAANGIDREPALRDAFDNVHELPLSRSLRDVRGLLESDRAIQSVVSAGYDIVHVHTPIAAFATRFAVARLPRAQRPLIVYTAHGFHFHHGGHPAANLVFLAAEMLAGRWTDRLVVINEEDLLAARRHRIVPSNRLVRMPGIGIDTEAYSPSALSPDLVAGAAKSLGFTAGSPMFVMVAELTRNKRVADAIEGLALMEHSEASLVVVGPGPDRPRLTALVDRACLGDRVRFTGFVDDVRPILAAATALVLASTREGLARSIMEALALGVPVIASTARGNRELVGPDAGIIVQTGDIKGFAAAMDWLIDHPLARDDMGHRGRARMVERYALRRLICLHEEMYRAMLEGK